ncbi:MAG: hypothetical protein EBT07_11375 [Actinobacteria bacterium]|nr:hypothetical protein [Actinomycetota bacterium]
MSATKERESMKLQNKVALIATAVITGTALVIASPALASKSHPKITSTQKTATTATPTPTPVPPTFGDGDGDFGGRHGHGRGDHDRIFTPITKTVTVDVPATGTYQLLVTEVKPANAPTPPAGAPIRPDHSFTVAVTGTGSQTITLNLPHPGDYKVSLISVVSTQSVTVPATN